MPTYEYIDAKTGKELELFVPMAEADKQPGLLRVFKTAPAVKVVTKPIDKNLPMKEKMRQSYSRIENKGGRWPSSYKKGQLKKVWDI